MTNQEIMQYTGEGIFVFLIIILLLKPIAYYLKKPRILIIRRYLGWITGLLGFTHLLYWALYYMQSITFLLMSFSQLWFLLGVFAMLSLFLMSISSNDRSVIWLKKKWKKIQVYGIHILVILGLLHAHLAIRGYDQTIWMWVVPLISLLIWRQRAWLNLPVIYGILVIGATVLWTLTSWDSSNVPSVDTEEVFPTTIADDSITGYTEGYNHNIFGEDAKIPHTWTEEDFKLCGEEPANLDTTVRVYCRNGDVHEK